MILHVLIVAVGVLDLIEQAFCYYLGSYPYLYGLPVKRMTLPVSNVNFWKSAQEKCEGLRIKVSEQREEIYCRYRYKSKYLSGGWGGWFFVGQIQFSTPGILLIRMCPGAVLLSLSASMYTILDRPQGVIDMLSGLFVVTAFFLFHYYMLMREVNRCAKEITSEIEIEEIGK